MTPEKGSLMDKATLAMLFEATHSRLHLNVEGITHSDSLFYPLHGGNCPNWVLGHIVWSRNSVLGLLGEAPVWNEQVASRYQRGSEPFADASEAQPLEEILAAFDDSQDTILTALKRTTEPALAAPHKQGTVGQRLAFLHCHEAYHIGQLGLLRRLLGKPGAIR